MRGGLCPDTDWGGDCLGGGRIKDILPTSPTRLRWRPPPLPIHTPSPIHHYNKSLMFFLRHSSTTHSHPNEIFSAWGHGRYWERPRQVRDGQTITQDLKTKVNSITCDYLTIRRTRYNHRRKILNPLAITLKHFPCQVTGVKRLSLSEVKTLILTLWINLAVISSHRSHPIIPHSHSNSLNGPHSSNHRPRHS